MRIEDIKVGDSIKNKKPYDGEGEYIVCDLSPPLFEGYFSLVYQISETKRTGILHR